MRKIFCLAFLSVMGSFASAQQKPHYNQYLQNMAVLNPAVTGMYHSVNIRSGFRNQWVGLESAPKTSYFNISTPINRGSSRSGFVDYGIEDPATSSDKDGYLSSSSHHAIGALLLNDDTGPLVRSTINLTYAFHLNLSDVANLSLGVGAGINRVSLNTEDLRFEDMNEPLISSGGKIVKMTPDLNAGIYFYSSSLYFGAVMQQALSYPLALQQDFTKGKEVPHYFIGGGYRFWLKEDYSVTPSFMLKYLSPLPASYDANLKIAYRNNLYIAGSYRKKDSFAAMFGFNIAKTVSLGYAFENTTSTLKKVTSGGHEIVLGINL